MQSNRDKNMIAHTIRLLLLLLILSLLEYYWEKLEKMYFLR